MSAGDQRDYWNQFIATVSWAAPCTVAGTVEARDTIRGSAPKGQPIPVYPVLRIRLDNGRGVIVNGTQARLLELLTLQAPGIGDRIEIAYKGESDKAAPGFSPTKEFDVRVIRKDSQSQGRPSRENALGEATGENAPGAGENG
jgi:hypothetical protein